MEFNFTNKEPIGRGREKIVYNDPRNKDRVIGIIHEKKRDKTVNQVEGRYCLQKILHILFPEIPDIHQSTQSHVVTEKRERDSKHMEFQEAKMAKEEALERGEEISYFHPLSHAVRQAQNTIEDRPNPKIIELKAKLSSVGIIFDGAVVNFSTEKDGNVTYLDTFDPWDIESSTTITPNYNKKKLSKAINALPNPQKFEATKLFSQLIELQKRDTNKKKA